MSAQASKAVGMFDEVVAGSALCTRPCSGSCEQELHHTSEQGLCAPHTVHHQHTSMACANMYVHMHVDCIQLCGMLGLETT